MAKKKGKGEKKAKGKSENLQKRLNLKPDSNHKKSTTDITSSAIESITKTQTDPLNIESISKEWSSLNASSSGVLKDALGSSTFGTPQINSLNMLGDSAKSVNEALSMFNPVHSDIMKSVLESSTLDKLQTDPLSLLEDSTKSASEALSAFSMAQNITKDSAGHNAWEAMLAATESVEKFNVLHPSISETNDSITRLTELTNQMRDVETAPRFELGRIELPTFTPNTIDTDSIPNKLEETTNQIVEKLEQQLLEKDSQHRQMVTVFGDFVKELSTMNMRLGNDAANADEHAKRSRNGMWISLCVTAIIAIGAVAQNHLASVSSSEANMRILEIEHENSKTLKALTEAINNLGIVRKENKQIQASTPTLSKNNPSKGALKIDEPQKLRTLKPTSTESSSTKSSPALNSN